MAASGDAAVVFTGMEVPQIGGRVLNGLRNILLFDIGVIRVEKNADPGVSDFLAKPNRILRSIEEVRFVPVQGLDRQCDAEFFQ